MELFGIILLIAVGVGGRFRRKNSLYVRGVSYHKKLSEELVFIQIKLPQKQSESEQKSDNIQSMKQNIEIMIQIYKNLYSLISNDKNSQRFGQPYISLECMIEKEVIKFLMAIPDAFVESFEKSISSFYPGVVVDWIEQPKILEAGKFIVGGNFSFTKNTLLPIKTYESFEADPMDNIISAFSKVNNDEKAIIQLLVSPVGEKEHEDLKKKSEKLKKDEKTRSGFVKFIGELFSHIAKDFSGKKDEEKKDESKEKNKYSHGQEGDIDKKVEEEIFAVSMRGCVISPDSKRAEKMMSDLERSLSQYNYVGMNAFQFKVDNDIDHFAKEFIHRRMVNKKNITQVVDQKSPHLIMSIKELASIFHFPHSRYNKNPRIKRQGFKIVPAPDTVPDEGMLLGYNLFGGVKREIRMKAEDRFRHFYIIGQTGTGKSTMLLVQAKDDMMAGRGFCLVDPHGDLCENLLDYFPKERIDDLIYFDAANFDYPIGFNILEAETEDERELIVGDLVDMFVSMYGNEIFGPRIQDYFINGCLTLMAQPEGGTLTEIVRLFVDKAYNAVKIKNVTNPVVRTRWEKTYHSMGDREKGEMIPYFQAKFGPFTNNGNIRNIIGQPKSSFNIYQAMQEKKIILMNLSKGKMGDVNSELLGRMIVTQIKVGAMKRAKIEQSQRIPYYLYIDEFQNYVSPSIESILSEARKYRLGLTVAHQYIDQLKKNELGGSLDLSKAIFGNVGSMLSYKVGAPDAEFLEKEFGPEFSQTDLVNMDKFKGVMKLSVDSQPTRPFSINILNPFTPPLNTIEKKDIIKQISALKRGRKKDLVEKEIFYRVGV